MNMCKQVTAEDVALLVDAGNRNYIGMCKDGVCRLKKNFYPGFNEAIVLEPKDNIYQLTTTNQAEVKKTTHETYSKAVDKIKETFTDISDNILDTINYYYGGR